MERLVLLLFLTLCILVTTFSYIPGRLPYSYPSRPQGLTETRAKYRSANRSRFSASRNEFNENPIRLKSFASRKL